jgi:hypothetical protein
MIRMLIITGPQGSGNHLFSKLFSAHPDVYGWKQLFEQPWVTHEHEPFNLYWQEPQLLKKFNWAQSDYYVTSISCPYINNYQECTPRYCEFFAELKKQKINTSVLIVGRDSNVLEYQQQRIRDKSTLEDFKKQLPLLTQQNPLYISQELAYLYKGNYLSSLGQQLNFPVTDDNQILSDILSVDANKKYFRPAEMSDLDLTIRRLNGL